MVGTRFAGVGVILLVFVCFGRGSEADHLSKRAGYAGLHVSFGDGPGLGGFLFSGVEESFDAFQHALFH